VARKLDRFPQAVAQRYPWSEWLDGDPWELTRGDDYSSKTATLISNARNQAKKAGGTVRTRILRRDDGVELCVLQFVRS
jgi:hypothetical protein